MKKVNVYKPQNLELEDYLFVFSRSRCGKRLVLESLLNKKVKSNVNSQNAYSYNEILKGLGFILCVRTRPKWTEYKTPKGFLNRLKKENII